MKSRLDTVLTFIFVRPLFQAVLTGFFSLEVEGADVLKHYPTPIFAGNHTGFLDGPIVLSAVDRPVRFIMAQAVLGWPVIGWLVRGIGILPLNPFQIKTSLKQAVQCLKTGQTLCIFPEGGLTTNGQLQPFHSGVTFLQAQSQLPIIPFAIDGGYEAWRWGQWVPKLRKVTLRFGQPIIATTQNKTIVLETLYNDVQNIKWALENRNKLYTQQFREA